MSGENFDMTTTKTIYYFRHGETDWNHQGRFQGHSDIPLNNTGVEQAKKLRPLLEEWRPEILISSDLKRAKQTARLANARLQAPHLIDPRLREINLGQAEGKTIVEVEALWGKQAVLDWITFKAECSDFYFPGGEKKIDSVIRVKTFLENILFSLPNQTLGVIGHGGTLKRFCHHIAQDKNREYPIPNCCVYKVQFDLSTRRWSEAALVSPV
ncbi:MAG: hypothetical protein RJB66_1530 [Pseudomonadota bacterium]|jgi:broad specificity phosphatase PhoE